MSQPRRKKRPPAHQSSQTPLESSGFRATVALIARAVGAQAPRTPPRLRKKLLDRIATAKTAAKASTKTPARSSKPSIQVWRAWGKTQADLDPTVVVRRAEDGGWEKIHVPGVSVRPLNVDPKRRYVTMLVRMEPGAAYPEHLHSGYEECYVLEGDLRVGKDVLHEGDYQYAQGGSEHGVQSTEEGCLLLIVSSQDDKLL